MIAICRLVVFSGMRLLSTEFDNLLQPEALKKAKP